MKKAARKIVTVRSKAISNATAASPVEGAFDEIVELIRAARQRAARAINSGLIELYWRIGDYLHRKIESDGWAKGTVVQLAAHIAQREPGQRGFSQQNLWRMRQFFVAYRGLPKLSPLLRELPWSSHLHILSRSKRSEEREFYLRLAAQNHWPVREVARQIESALFARAVLNPPKLSTALRELHPAAASHFKDAYRPVIGSSILPAYADHLLRTPLYAAEYQRRSTGVNSSRLIEHADHQRLKRVGLVEGRYPNGIVAGALANATGEAARHIRERGFNKQYYVDLVLALLTEYGPVGRREIDELLLPKLPDRLSDQQKRRKVHNLLQELRRTDKIANQGSRAAPNWVILGADPARQPQ